MFTPRLLPCGKTTFRTFATPKTYRPFTTSAVFKMPEALKKEEVEKGQDPSVAKQYDDETPTEQKFEVCQARESEQRLLDSDR